MAVRVGSEVVGAVVGSLDGSVVGCAVVGSAVGLDVVGSWVGLDVVGLLVGFDVVGLLVGFVAGVVTPGRVELRHLTMASSVRTRHPELLDLLGEAFVDASQMPWAEVVVAPGCPALAHLSSETVTV